MSGLTTIAGGPVAHNLADTRFTSLIDGDAAGRGAGARGAGHEAG
jgi:hypothetical protein